ncbi:3-isopropylmalate dehydrogenase [Geovibrio thiophilus]|uniref:3-isopropylmalate dehydrogenase n=1 Tax=Geovibrio thiophilus TaxID=139438 RepID=A0A3R5V1B4_9BACT|nr:3-isopropylmalate dehydrogenase [Geovibrio thiophilus]QAR33241.1 3-isopropylmalate dehydrogenase [Geovibrio thiophilus]
MRKVAVLPGDGIGPEVMKQAIKVLGRISEKYNTKFEFKFADVGGIAIDNHGTPLPDSTLKLCEASEAILFGSVGGPKWENLPPAQQPERGALLPLRKHFGLFANLRPVKIFKALIDSSSLKNSLIPDGLDIVFFRELTGGIYFGQPKEISEDRQSARDTMLYTVPEVERIARQAFEAAKLRGNKVMSVDKANVLMTSVLWRETVTRLHKEEYSDVELAHMYVDNAAMQLVRYPSQFDVIVTENMFGDILSDEAAMLTGSLGMLPSASLNEDGFGLYEPIGGTAPDIAGQNIANPIAQIMSAALMLRYSFKMDDAAADIENAIEALLAEGVRTRDIFRDGQGLRLVNTDEMGDLIVSRI